MKLHLTAALLLAAFAGAAQEVPLSDFGAVDTPAIYSAEWYRMNNVRNEFTVGAADGTMHIFRGATRSAVQEFSLPQGSLLGVDQGEFGGGLYYKPADSLHPDFFVNGRPGPGKKTFFGGLMVPPTNPLVQRLKGYSLVVSGNVRALFRYKDSLFFMQGLAHMGLMLGSLYSLSTHQDSFTVAKVMDIGDCPMAWLVDGPRLWVATDSGFLLLENGQVHWLFKHLFWSGLYPTAVCRDADGMLYVGLRGGYAKLNAGDRKISFYKYLRD